MIRFNCVHGRYLRYISFKTTMAKEKWVWKIGEFRRFQFNVFSSSAFWPFMLDEEGCFLFLSKFRGPVLTLIKLTIFLVACSSKIPVERILTKQSWIAICIWQGAFLGETTPIVCTKKKTRVEKEVISEWTSSIQNLWRFFHISGKDNPRRLKTKKN